MVLGVWWEVGKRLQGQGRGNGSVHVMAEDMKYEGQWERWRDGHDCIRGDGKTDSGVTEKD